MLNNYDRVVAELAKLIEEGRNILTRCGYGANDLSGWNDFPSDDEYIRVRTRASNLIRRTCGEKSIHSKEMDGIENRSTGLPSVVGVLEAAKADIEGGLLIDLKQLVEAEILGDFLDQAEALLSAGYYVPAASLVGVVLEDTLRKMCDAANIAYPANTTIDRLNAELAKAAIYGKLTQKQITAQADIRNNADHGRSERFKLANVEEMVSWVKRFVAEHSK